ncbi:MAG: hypothetical protein H7839_02435 [Magnetococcus sp. YQC-5]
MSTVIAALLVVLFIVMFKKSPILATTKIILLDTRKAFQVLLENNLSDDAKECYIQAAAKDMLLHFFRISLYWAVVIVVPILLLFFVDALGLSNMDAVLHTFFQWWFIIGSSILFIVATIRWK